MNPSRYLTEDRVDLALDAAFDEERPATVERVAEHMGALLARSEDVLNVKRLVADLVQVERRHPALLGGGIAYPHVRSLQARRPIMACAISRAGLVLPTPDDLPIRVVVALVGPPYDDKLYLQIHRALGERMQIQGWTDALVAASHPGEILRALAR